MRAGEAREFLRRETRSVHDCLDRMAGSKPLSGERPYAEFLTCQHRARSAFEAAFRDRNPLNLSAPPEQTSLIAQDLAELGAPIPAPMPSAIFQTSRQALGAAWVIAGSSMGNRAMLAQRRKASIAGADRFLADERMPVYFRSLLEVLGQLDAADFDDLREGALQTFSLFQQAFSVSRQELAA